MNNLPNKLTILRMVMVPLVMFFLLNNFISREVSHIVAALLFVVASLTDWLDGFLARKYNLITNFGKVMDPLADKLIVTAVMLCLIKTGVFPVWCAMIIIGRDFLVSGMRIIASKENMNVAASMWGKVKTLIQMIAFTVAILFGESSFLTLYYVTKIVIYISTLATLISGISYCRDYRKIFQK